MPPEERKPHGGARPGAGRPPKSSEPREERVYLRLTTEERQQLEAEAQAASLPLSSLLRRKLGLPL